jgi:hypothetical protein
MSAHTPAGNKKACQHMINLTFLQFLVGLAACAGRQRIANASAVFWQNTADAGW